MMLSAVVKNPPANVGDVGLIPGSGRYFGTGNDNQLASVFLPETSHGQRSLVACSPCGSQVVRHDSAVEHIKSPNQF